MPAFKKVKKGQQVTRCDQDLIDAIVKYLRIGAYPETAAAMCGVSKERFIKWLKWSHKDHPHYKKHYKPIYAKLRHAVEQAVEECSVRDLYNIDKCAMGEEPQYMKDEKGGIVYAENGKPIILKPGMSPDWHASAWRLERRRASHWANTSKFEHSGPDGGPIQTQETPETPEEAEARRERMKHLVTGLKDLDEPDSEGN